MTNKFLEAALKYNEIGFSVIPFTPGEKKPIVSWREYQSKKASIDEIKRWWSQTPNANVGIVTGKLSNLFVIDLDKYKPDYNETEVNKLISDSIVTPTAISPQGGQHLYFSFPEEALSINAGVIPGVDYRGEGGVIVSPPSINGNGRGYSWIEGLSIFDLPLAQVPQSFKNALFNNDKYIIKGGIVRGGDDKGIDQSLQSEQSLQFLQEGQRDQSLFHVANCLAKGGLEKNLAYKVIEIIGNNCIPPFPKHESYTKVDSAFERVKRRERNIAEEIDTFINLTTPYIYLTEVYETLQFLQPNEKSAAQVHFCRLVKDGKLKKLGRGHFAKIEPAKEPMKLFEKPSEDFPIILPIHLNDVCSVKEGNLICVAGSKSSGKTTFLLNVVTANQHKIPVVYINSEMGEMEFTGRLEAFGGKKEDWVFSAYRYNEIEEAYDLITDERKIFIVDFIEQHDDFYAVAKKLKIIADKIKSGIVIVAIQKDPTQDLGRGKWFSAEKARLYITLDYLHGQNMSQCKIVDAKFPKGRSNARGGFCYYKITGKGSKIDILGNWRWPTE